MAIPFSEYPEGSNVTMLPIPETFSRPIVCGTTDYMASIEHSRLNSFNIPLPRGQKAPIAEMVINKEGNIDIRPSLFADTNFREAPEDSPVYNERQKLQTEAYLVVKDALVAAGMQVKGTQNHHGQAVLNASRDGAPAKPRDIVEALTKARLLHEDIGAELVTKMAGPEAGEALKTGFEVKRLLAEAEQWGVDTKDLLRAAISAKQHGINPDRALEDMVQQIQPSPQPDGSEIDPKALVPKRA